MAYLSGASVVLAGASGGATLVLVFVGAAVHLRAARLLWANENGARDRAAAWIADTRWWKYLLSYWWWLIPYPRYYAFEAAWIGVLLLVLGLVGAVSALT